MLSLHLHLKKLQRSKIHFTSNFKELDITKALIFNILGHKLIRFILKRGLTDNKIEYVRKPIKACEMSTK